MFRGSREMLTQDTVQNIYCTASVYSSIDACYDLCPVFCENCGVGRLSARGELLEVSLSDLLLGNKLWGLMKIALLMDPIGRGVIFLSLIFESFFIYLSFSPPPNLKRVLIVRSLGFEFSCFWIWDFQILSSVQDAARIDSNTCCSLFISCCKHRFDVVDVHSLVFTSKNKINVILISYFSRTWRFFFWILH